MLMLRVTEADADPKPIILEIRTILPAAAAYSVGETVTVYTGFPGLVSTDVYPTGMILIRDGTTSCTIQLPKNSCDLKFADSGTKKITARYLGDGLYAAVQSDPVDVNVDESSKIGTKTVISGIMPALSAYEIGDSIEVYVKITPDQQGEQLLSGTISVTDGYSSCTIDPGGENFCNLKLINGMASKIDANYSGDPIYAASVSDSYPIMISMVDIGASVQAMAYAGCEAYHPDPDHTIISQIDTSVSPAMKYFSVDESFLAGSGFYINVTLTAKNGQFGTDPGSVSAKLCSKADNSYCLSTQPAEVVRDAFVLTRAAATLEFPVIHRAGNFYLEIEYSGDSVVYGVTKSFFDIRGINKGILILTPADFLIRLMGLILNMHGKD